MDACLQAAIKVHGDIANTNATFKAVNDSMLAFRNNGYQWWQVAELNYDSYMVRHVRA
jgi:TRAP-type mannitol/chloroaromatic compound transport system substrate-binding protein